MITPAAATICFWILRLRLLNISIAVYAIVVRAGGDQLEGLGGWCGVSNASRDGRGKSGRQRSLGCNGHGEHRATSQRQQTKLLRKKIKSPEVVLNRFVSASSSL